MIAATQIVHLDLTFVWVALLIFTIIAIGALLRGR